MSSEEGTIVVKVDRLRFIAFMAMWLIVGLVGAYDAFLTVKYSRYLNQLELNPVGRWIMKLDFYRGELEPTEVALFLALKFAGTILVLGALSSLYWFRERLGLTVAAALAAFQVMLFTFLMTG